MCAAAAPAPERGWKSEKVDEAQALARSCAARRPDFQPCDGLSICATHSHGKCFKLHWCCHLGWCHCKSNLMSPPFAAVPGRPPGRPGSRQGLCGLGGSGLGRGCSAAGQGRPGVRAAGTALVPDQSGRRCLGNEMKSVGSLALATSTKGDLSTCPRKMGHVYIKKKFFFPFRFSTETTRQCVEKGSTAVRVDDNRRGSLFSGLVVKRCSRLFITFVLTGCYLKEREPLEFQS